MNKKIQTIVLISIIGLSGCVQQPNISDTNERFGGASSQDRAEYNIKYVKPKGKKIVVNALDTIIPQRTREVIMRGVLMPYEANGVMYDSSFTYNVVRDAGWITDKSTKIRHKKVLGSINGL